MIKNIVFDIGNVLVDFRWRDLMTELKLSDAEQDKFEVSVFGSRWWQTLDHGTLEEAEAVEHLREDNQKYIEAFDLLWENRDKLVSPYPYSVEWIKELKSRGYNVYLLSNYPKDMFNLHAQVGSFPFLPLVDGKVVSAFVKMIKPNADIYELLLNKYDLKAQECVFLDDRTDNIEGARKVGMHGIVFQNYEQAKKELDALLK